VYRFLQKPGDLVWVNSGCVHWAQADGWCNNIEWRVGPLTHLQYKNALERFEWNKMQYVRPTVPMTALTWNVARNIRLQDVKLYDMIKYALLQSLKQAALTFECVKSKGIEVQRQRPTVRRAELFSASKFCGLCEREVFAVIFVRGEEEGGGGKPLVHCLNCALKKMPSLKGFVCLEEIRLKELMEIYDNFKPHSVSTQQLPPPPPSPSVNPPSSNAAAAHQAAFSAAATSASVGGSSGGLTTPTKSPSSGSSSASSSAAAAAAAAAQVAAQHKAAQAAWSAAYSGGGGRSSSQADKVSAASQAATMQAMAAAMGTNMSSMTPAEQATLAAMLQSYGATANMDLG